MKELLIISAIFCYPSDKDCTESIKKDNIVERVYVRAVTDWEKLEEKPTYIEHHEKDICIRYQRLPY